MNTHNGTKSDLSCIKPKQKLVPAHFALIIIIVVHVVKHQSVINQSVLKLYTES